MGPRYKTSFPVYKERSQAVDAISTESASPREATEVDAPHLVTQSAKRDSSAQVSSHYEGGGWTAHPPKAAQLRELNYVGF
jgi:hypothetical protein